jgi:PadR family transcriptional regulator, regulatory protein AphA
MADSAIRKLEMTIQFTILGLLSWKPMSGYDLKKVISSTDIFYWSGNNNQIYKSLIQLHHDELVDPQVLYKENLPAKKIYTITEKGKAELRKWVLSNVEIPEYRSNFLLQLAWADQFSEEEIQGLFGRYEEEIRIHIQMMEEKSLRSKTEPKRTPREAYLWEKMVEHLIAIYRVELDWVQQTRQGLSLFAHA